jgi:hypothetical protein
MTKFVSFSFIVACPLEESEQEADVIKPFI